ncbi:hypothetical protein LCGC14_2351220 [marine sediment metagenome]|uniref:RiboL-PSP-HEPN domain-containing protein n=1 Tax=marine sediment metagenome TaxID=412755 RepID=A0A0F9C932_9ZZZZ
MENFWERIINYKIPKISNILLDVDTNKFHYDQTSVSTSNWDKFTEEYLNFSLNINKIALFLIDLKYTEDLLDSSPINASFNAKRIDLNFIGKCQSLIIFLATAVEIYCESVFRTASSKFDLVRLDSSNLEDFYRRFYLTPLAAHTKLSDMLKPRMDFQNKDNLKIAYRLIGIHLPTLTGILWQEIFDTNRVGSLLQLRHRIVHNGLEIMKDHQFSFDEVYELTMKSIRIVYQIETRRTELHLHDRDIVIIR